jgi:ribonuclease Z
MAKLIVLGCSNAIPTLGNENTHFVLTGGLRTILVDCASNPVVRLEQAGVPLHQVTDIILTHFHPDHVGGIPLLLMDMWLLGRQAPLDIHGLEHTLERVEKVMDLYGWKDWPNFYEVCFRPIPRADMSLFLEDADLRVYASPVKHFLPNIGLRFEAKDGGRSLAYSCDTEPCSQVFRLADGVDILLHEAAGDFTGHSSAGQAADVARVARVGALILIHYPTGRLSSGDLVAEARRKYQGPISLAVDLMEIPL